MDTNFKFGKNWLRYLKKIDEVKINYAKNSLIEFLGELKNKSFLDAGCGSGLFSLAALRLGAKVTSFDIDNEAVYCCKLLWEKEGKPNNWVIKRGSI
ncbi:MAG: 50S ribosomal protein L11 methyltransferase, partial [bacterium]|nr:50S ribosomal protein L11 methyltransferase [bacterium]